MSELPSVTISWPERKKIFGVPVTPTNYDEAVEYIMDAACKNISACIDFMPVHGLITATEDAMFGKAISEKFDMVCPDGQPVRWALNRFHKSNLTDRVYGPTLTLQLLKRAEGNSVPIYFYGSRCEVLEKLKANLLNKFPLLTIAGMESPPFRTLTEKENTEAAERIIDSGAKILLVGLGCPKQELWAAKNKELLPMPILCVGAAFDFHAGTLKQAPSWMQECGLEWLYRLYAEPGRLWKRYLIYNTKFICFSIKESYKIILS